MAVQTAVLRTLYAGGILTLAVIAPKITRFLPHPDQSKKRRKELYERISQAMRRLKQRGYIENSEGRYRLTERGEKSVERILMYEYKVPEQIHWDGRWRMLLFDVREKRRKTRTKLRHLLEAAGFLRLQDSVWIYPYPCDEFVALVRAQLASGVGELRSTVVEALESDRAFREHFNLII